MPYSLFRSRCTVGCNGVLVRGLRPEACVLCSSQGDKMMSMTFYPFNTYQIPGVVWDWWDVETKGQFAASCFAVIVAVIVYRGLVKLEQRFIRYAVMLGSPARRGGNLQGLELGASLLDLDDGTESTYRGPIVIPFWCRLVQAVFSGLLYGYALLLMLVAMAYNPGLFLSLMAGWVIGELLFPTSFDAVAASLHAGKAAACCDR